MGRDREISESIVVLKKIRELTKSMVRDLSGGRSPTISIDRFKNYCTDSMGNCCCSLDVPCGKETVTLQRECHARRLGCFLLFSNSCKKTDMDPREIFITCIPLLLQLPQTHGGQLTENDLCFPRYVQLGSCSAEQPVVDRAINDLCIILRCSRHNLNVVSVGNGLVMGWLIFTEAERKFDCINRLNIAHPVPVCVEEVKDLRSSAQYILVVEKESVFQRLADDHYCSTNRCVVITGRGYPDVSTRRFLRLLVEKLHLPVYCLVDCDPYGFDILSTYRFGSMQMAYDAKLLRVQGIRWLGAFPSDMEKYSIPEQCLLPLTAEDKKRTEAMLQRCYLQREVPEWRLELELMLHRGVKFEIEALSVHSISFLTTDYIPSKIHGKLYI